MIQYYREGKRSYSSLPRQQKLSMDPPRAGNSPVVRLSRGGNRTRGKDPADLPLSSLKAYPLNILSISSRASFIVERMGSESKGCSFRSWFGGFRATLDQRFYLGSKGLGREKESKSMDINEPSFMDVAHDTINSTQGLALIEVAYSPSSEGKGQGFFLRNSGPVS